MSKEAFQELMTRVATAAADRPLDADLAHELNERFPPDGETYRAITEACHKAIEEGWMCHHANGDVHFSRPVRPGPDTAGFSVDVVRMKDCRGPHHRHPNGEITMVMPITPGAKFDGAGPGWKVYPPDSAHFPTVSDGEAVVLYLLPDGAIEFTGKT